MPDPKTVVRISGVFFCQEWRWPPKGNGIPRHRRPNIINEKFVPSTVLYGLYPVVPVPGMFTTLEMGAKDSLYSAQ